MGSVRGRAVLDFLRHRFKFPHTAQYDTKQFWEMSYASAVRPHEWGCAGDKLLSYAFRDASTHRPVAGAPGAGTLAADCAEDGRLLLLGGGTSALGGDLLRAGWRNVAAVDFSEVAVDLGKRREPEVAWQLGDGRDLGATYAAGSFDAVLDKGTVDAIYLSAGPDHAADVGRVAASAADVLVSRGTFAVLSLSRPAYLWPLLVGDGRWDLPASEVRDLGFIYLYLLRKRRSG